MSEHDETGDVQVSDAGSADAGLAAEAVAGDARADVHVITLRGAEGWQLDHPSGCAEPGDCAFTEAAGRVSRAFCETLGRWTCDVSGAGLVLVERLGDS